MLINCSECGEKVSDKASACPHCGNPIIRQISTTNDCPCEERGASETSVATDSSERSLHEVISAVKSVRKKIRLRRFCRAPLSVTIPSILNMALISVLTAYGVTETSGIYREEVVWYRMFLLGHLSVCLGLYIGFIRGSSIARGCISLGMWAWVVLMLSKRNTALTAIIILAIAIFWTVSVHLLSASRWLIAHKWVARRRKLKKLQAINKE